MHRFFSLTCTGQYLCFCSSIYIGHLHLRNIDIGHCEVQFTVLLCRLYEKNGEAAIRSFSQFHPIISPANVMIMAQQSHFLAYLDNLVQSQPEEHRYNLGGGGVIITNKTK